MACQRGAVNASIRADTPAFLAQCDRDYQDRIARTARAIADRLAVSPIVLLTGPSGSGKTTTALKLAETLRQLGVGAQAISLDNYFVPLEPDKLPRTETGEVDMESPAFLDMPLLDETFTRLSQGLEVQVPRFDFAHQMRDENGSRSLRLEQNEIAIFEGIHALCPGVSGPHPEATKLYVSPRSEFSDGEQLLFDGPMLRLSRRLVRDHNFRGTDAAETLALWANVRRGERLYIDPYRSDADLTLDTSLPYEVSVMKGFTLPLLEQTADTDSPETEKLRAAFEGFEAIDPEFVDTRSLLREFIGGSSYRYH